MKTLDDMMLEMTERAKRASPSQRTGRSSGAQRKVCRNESGDSDQDDRMEQERDQESEGECEATLEEALTNQSKVVKVIVDKWFVDKGFAFASQGESLRHSNFQVDTYGFLKHFTLATRSCVVAVFREDVHGHSVAHR